MACNQESDDLTADVEMVERFPCGAVHAAEHETEQVLLACQLLAALFAYLDNGIDQRIHVVNILLVLTMFAKHKPVL